MLRLVGWGKTYRELARRGMVLFEDPQRYGANEDEYQQRKLQQGIARQERIADNRIQKHAEAIARAEAQVKAAKRKLAMLKRMKVE